MLKLSLLSGCFRFTICSSLVLTLLTGCYDSYPYGADSCSFPDGSEAACGVKPIYQSWDEIRGGDPLYLSAENATVETQLLIDSGSAVREFYGLEKSGKIIVVDDLLLIHEPFSGIYVFDNSEPASPTYLYFFRAFGSSDFAVSNGIVYVDSFRDLLAFELINPGSWNRTQDVLYYDFNRSQLPENVRFSEVVFDIKNESVTSMGIELDTESAAVIGYINSNGKSFYFDGYEL